MQVIYHPYFSKAYTKSSPKIKRLFNERLEIFMESEFNPILNNHKLYTPFEGHRSINITGDVRAIYKRRDKNTIVFYKLGTHSQLYS